MVKITPFKGITYNYNKLEPKIKDVSVYHTSSIIFTPNKEHMNAMVNKNNPNKLMNLLLDTSLSPDIIFLKKLIIL